MSKPRILVVEDDFDISNMLRIYFQSQGYEVAVAPRGGDALEMCRQQLPNIVVLDIMLPDIDGYEVCRQLRSNLRTSHIPIIFLTQKDERSDKIQGLELGADDYITKPFGISRVILTVRNLIEKRCLAIEKKNYQTSLEFKVMEQTDQIRRTMNDLHSAYDSTLTALVKALDAREKEVGSHSERVMNFSTLMAGKLGISGN